jgi:hypothetical protein
LNDNAGTRRLDALKFKDHVRKTFVVQDVALFWSSCSTPIIVLLALLEDNVITSNLYGYVELVWSRSLCQTCMVMLVMSILYGNATYVELVVVVILYVMALNFHLVVKIFPCDYQCWVTAVFASI